jgi:predicted nuclease of predicted toxin-antitoxin system
MRLLADENTPYPAIVALRDHGNDVVSVAELSPGATDTDIFAWAIRDDRIIITFDKDFGDIARRTPASAQCGVILFRGALPPPREVGRYFVDVINARSDWAGHFAVVEFGRIRRWPLKHR